MMAQSRSDAFIIFESDAWSAESLRGRGAFNWLIDKCAGELFV